MSLIYQSTRDKNNQVTSSQAILQGLAVDGGLYVPTVIPNIDLDFDFLKNASYQEVAKVILSAFLDDFTEEELSYCIDNAYDKRFDDSVIAPLVKVGEHYNLELFHGNTIAFKDMALSILPYLLTTSAKKEGVENEIVILTATSGDTGKAAMAGFADVPNTQIIVFYPKDGVSEIQKQQMVTQTGDNTHVVAIDGNFDDAQTQVKKMFNDTNLREKMLANNKQFSSANSMNIGRLVPQIVYYVYAYAQLLKNGAIAEGEKVNFSVPTGNFGNILAAYYAKQIGLPINKLICASNENNVLTDFFNTGAYDKNRDFFVTSSPSMDILVSSNLERLVFHATGNNDLETRDLMDKLVQSGKYEISDEMNNNLEDFIAGFASQKQTSDEIATISNKFSYVEDPHTAVANAVYDVYKEGSDDKTITVVVSTASPYKFPRVVVEALTSKTSELDDFALVDELEKLSGVEQPTAVKDLKIAPVLHKTVVDVDQMQDEVEKYLKLK
ncbi:threonine synthase [Floricoccus penangensis]|uniref:threonine synthase n=1 Tax=Floricoccus penangensis TaxID=1859475 RepID=UPI00203B5D65|nr:threonine synthase [Floricoccus penangensis]URZ87443.1 threonine synthase [Floricoccus penangensis]